MKLATDYHCPSCGLPIFQISDVSLLTSEAIGDIIRVYFGHFVIAHWDVLTTLHNSVNGKEDTDKVEAMLRRAERIRHADHN